MTLNEAFINAVRKFYEGSSFDATVGHDPKAGEYSFDNLDTIHKDLVKGKPEPKAVEGMPEDMKMDDMTGEVE